MPRRQVPIVPMDPYHINARCINREWFQLPLETVWSIMEDYLWLINAMFELRIHAFLLMSNHFHWLVTAPNGNLSAALLFFMRETSKEITRLSGRINQTYGTRNHKTHIPSYHHFMNTYKYIYQNPLRAGICKQVEDYPFSSLHGLCGLKKLFVPLVEDTILFTPNFDERILSWLNTRSKPEHDEAMHQALRRPQLEFKTCRKTGRPNPLENELI